MVHRGWRSVCRDSEGRLRARILRLWSLKLMPTVKGDSLQQHQTVVQLMAVLVYPLVILVD